jgi:hypothetical protein
MNAFCKANHAGVMPGLDPGIHDEFQLANALQKVSNCGAASWIAGSSPAMTQ